MWGKGGKVRRGGKWRRGDKLRGKMMELWKRYEQLDIFRRNRGGIVLNQTWKLSPMIVNYRGV